MLKPEKWHATFDDDGKIFGFQKALKSIVLGVRHIYFTILNPILVYSNLDFYNSV